MGFRESTQTRGPYCRLSYRGRQRGRKPALALEGSQGHRASSQAGLCSGNSRNPLGSAPCKGLQFPGPPLLPGFPLHPCCQALTTSQPCSHRTLCPESSSMTDLLRSLGRHHLLQEALCDHEPLSSFSSTDQNWTLCSVTPLPCHQDGAPGGVSTAPMALP